MAFPGTFLVFNADFSAPGMAGCALLVSLAFKELDNVNWRKFGGAFIGFGFWQVSGRGSSFCNKGGVNVAQFSVCEVFLKLWFVERAQLRRTIVGGTTTCPKMKGYIKTYTRAEKTIKKYA